MAEREPGSYWVRCRLFPSREGDWEVAQYVGGLWRCAGVMEEFTDDDIVEIGDRAEREGAARLLEAIKRTRCLEDQLTKILGVLGPTAWPEPLPITDAQKTGERFLVWNDSEHPDTRGWFTAFYDGKIDGWLTGALGGYTELDRVVAHLPLPPDVEP
jgi:hypothetical protein